jgi:hypothetical protein
MADSNPKFPEFSKDWDRKGLMNREERNKLVANAAAAQAAAVQAARVPPAADHLLPQQLYSKIERLESANAAITKSLTALGDRVREIDHKFMALSGHYTTFTANILPRIKALESRQPSAAAQGGRRRKTRKAKKN